MKPVVINKKTNVLYQYEGDGKFTNLCTGVSGVVDDEVAKKSFLMHVEATMILDEFPVVKELIRKLNLKIDKT